MAIKKLGGTDLGWFRSLYHRFSNSNLKGINLNAAILIDDFYRDLAVIAAATNNRLAVGVTMFGPGAAAAYPGTYKLVKSPGSKNWRLNGTLVSNPLNEDHRFEVLQPNDIAVIAFDGRPAPTEITLILLAAADPGDALLHGVLAPLLNGGRQTMISVDSAVIRHAIDLPGVPANHPLGLLLADEEIAVALEDAVQGGITGIRRLRRARGTRVVTAGDIDQANREMSRVGAEGEALVNGYLSAIRHTESNREHEWTSLADPYCPYDFRCKLSEGSEFLVDVKSTKRGFDGNFHISIGEVVCAAGSDVPYFIYRVYKLTDAGCSLRISEDIRTFARNLLAVHDNNMPNNVTADSFSVPIDTSGIFWGEEILVPSVDIDGEASS